MIPFGSCAHCLCSGCLHLLVVHAVTAGARERKASQSGVRVLCPICRHPEDAVDLLLRARDAPADQRCQSSLSTQSYHRASSKGQLNSCGNSIADTASAMGLAHVTPCGHWICGDCWQRSRACSSFCPAQKCREPVLKPGDYTWIPPDAEFAEDDSDNNESDSEVFPNFAEVLFPPQEHGREHGVSLFARWLRAVGGSQEASCCARVACLGGGRLIDVGESAVRLPCGHFCCLPCWFVTGNARMPVSLCPHPTCVSVVRRSEVLVFDGPPDSVVARIPATVAGGNTTTTQSSRPQSGKKRLYNLLGGLCFVSLVIAMVVLARG